MKRLEVVTPKGILKYRMPNIEEGYYFLAAIEKMSTAQDLFMTKGKFISLMHNMVDYKDLGYESYQDFLDDRENNAEAMSEVVSNVFDVITRELRKKN